MQVRLIKRERINNSTSLWVRTFSILLSLAAISLFLLITGFNPLDIIIGIFKGSLGSIYKVKKLIIRAIPLLITASGVSVAFRMKFWNIGGEGQIFMGAFGAALVALKFPHLPMQLMLTLMLIVSVVIGGLWALVSGILKVYFNSNETIVTLMLNYIALKFVTYLQYGPWKDKKAQGFPKIPNFSESAVLPDFLGIHAGWVIAVIVIVLVYLYMNHSKKGFEISVIGESISTARYAGININHSLLSAVFLSGALCGLAGFIQASAVSQTLTIEITGGVGYTAIITAWLAGLKMPFILLVSLLFSSLLEGSSYIQTSMGIPSSSALIIQAVILFFVLGSEIFIKYRFTTVKGRKTSWT